MRRFRRERRFPERSFGLAAFTATSAQLRKAMHSLLDGTNPRTLLARRKYYPKQGCDPLCSAALP
jgi:hypothetical protein